MNNFKFIKVFDEETKNELLKCGFKLISNDKSSFLFLNDGKLVFDKKLKVKYTNILSL